MTKGNPMLNNFAYGNLKNTIINEGDTRDVLYISRGFVGCYTYLVLKVYGKNQTADVELVANFRNNEFVTEDVGTICQIDLRYLRKPFDEQVDDYIIRLTNLKRNKVTPKEIENGLLFNRLNYNGSKLLGCYTYKVIKVLDEEKQVMARVIYNFENGMYTSSDVGNTCILSFDEVYETLKAQYQRFCKTLCQLCTNRDSLLSNFCVSGDRKMDHVNGSC